LSYAEMIAGSLSVVVLRATVTGVGIMFMGVFFHATYVESWPLFLFWVISVSAVFGLLGIVVGLWSKSFEQLNMPVVFFLTPLSMVGGVFNTVDMLPSWLRWLAWANPFYYFINGLRGSMIGYDETPAGLAIGLTLVLLVVLGGTVWRLYAKGYGLRE
jgi:ABC-2 type transport system permease protein